ncbi:MAG: YbbR-like domain-containing protein [Desulfurivibrionaceae bacterium]
MDKLAASQIKLLNLKDWRKNWGLKLTSFLFAIVLWYFVVGVDKVDRTFSIPVEIVNLPENIIITNQFKKELEIRVTGPLGLIRKMEQGNLRREVDLSGVSPGSLVIKNTKENLSIPGGVRLRNVSPRNIILKLDRLIDKKIPVVITTSGQPESGYEVTSINVNPDKIHVTGPRTLLENLEKFSSEPVKLNNRSSSFRVSTTLEIPEPVTELIGEPVVDAHVIIKKKKEGKDK